MTVRRVRWGTECEDCDILALFGSDFADDFAKALDKMGWMIIVSQDTRTTSGGT